MMKIACVLLFTIFCLAVAQPPPIWSVTGGPIGIGSCYDIVTEEITFPAYKWNYATQNTVTVRGRTFLIPDEVFGYSTSTFQNDSRIFLMNSFQYYYQQYVTSWNINAGATIANVTLGLAFSHTKGQINEYLNNSVNYFAENVMTWSEFLLQMWPGEATLDPRFLKEVNKLPKEYNPTAYGEFISNFGTHIINKAWYGAAINFTSVFKSDLVNKKSIEWTQSQVKLTINWMMFNAGLDWNNFRNNTRIDNTFIENAKNVTIIQGGQPDVLQSGGFKQWWETVINDYAVIFAKSQLQPLYKIIPDPVISSNMKTATIAYGTGKLRTRKTKRIPIKEDA